MEYLREAGIAEEQLARIKYPTGLNIGAVTPDEIAISILAEIVEYRRRHLKVEVPTVTPIEESAGTIDPVCGMTVNVASAHYTGDYNGQTFYFCSAGCQRAFEKTPEDYLVKE